MDNLKGDRTVDVLGLSRSMEAVSNILFPATSTLHKKIRYQIFVPSIFLAMYSRRGKFDAEKMLRELEYQLQRTLIDSGEKYSVFGSNRGEALKYWPSMIYWSSLNALKFFGETGLGRYEALEIIEERIKAIADKNQEHSEIDPRVIVFPPEFEKIFERIFPNGKIATHLGFNLTRDEAKFLKDRFLRYHPNSMTSYILNSSSQLSPNQELFKLKCPKNKKLSYLLDQSQNFSCAAMGANFAYRWALCQAKKIKSAEKINWEHLRHWLDNNRKKLSSWKFDDLITAANQIDQSFSEKGETSFLNNFIQLVFADKEGPRPQALSDLMRNREEKIKGRHMSHFNNEKMQSAKNVLGKEEYQDWLFDYRWPQGRENLIDIFNGLKRK